MTLMTIADSGSWSIGVLVGVPVVALLLLVGLAWIGLCLAEREWAYIWLGIGWIVLVVAVSAWRFYPYSGEYHQWREASGTVAQIDKRLIGSGDKMEDKFVVRFQGDNQQFGCDDTRCAAVREGDQLTLSCKRAWQYTGTDGYDCRFVSTEPAR